MKRLRVRMVLTPNGPIENAAVITQSEWIIAVGSFVDLASIHVEEEIDLGEQLLLPGLINAHCHLDYTSIGRNIAPTKYFTQWIHRLNSLKQACTDEDYLAAIGAGLKEFFRWGTTSVFNVTIRPRLIPYFLSSPLRIWWFFELMDIRTHIGMDDLSFRIANFSKKHFSRLRRVGLAPHAPYTVSADLYRRIKSFAETTHTPVTTHLAETSEELEMFKNGTGSLFEFLKSLGRNMLDCRKKSPVALLLEGNLLPPGAILVHMNFLDKHDWEIMHHRRDLYVVHCPKTHAYFKREKFRLDQFRKCGIIICLGTDSLASNNSLNLFEEMQLFQREYPHLTEQEILKMVTIYPAVAIGQPDRLGKIVPGAYADLIAIPYVEGVVDVYAAVLAHRLPIEWSMLRGEISANL